MEAWRRQNQTGCQRTRRDSPRRNTARFRRFRVAISNHLRSSRVPAFVDEPRQVTIERDRAAVADPGRAQPHDGAPQHLSAHVGAVAFPFPPAVPPRCPAAADGWSRSARRRPRRRSTRARCPGRTHADTMRCSSNASRRRAPRRSGQFRTHSCLHCPVRGSNFNIRVLPVSPKIRTAYCASRRLRM